MNYNNDIKNVFRKDSDYKYDTNPILDYIRAVENTMLILKNRPINVKQYIKDNKRYRDPIVFFYERDENGDRQKKKEKLTTYFKNIEYTKSVVAPSFTCYTNPNIDKSLHAEFIDGNLILRSKHKKLAHKYKLEELFDKFIYHNVIQKSKKTFNNSLSGTYASAGTALNNPSAHYTLTSITRCLSGIGNAMSESFISGNKHFKDPDVTIEYISTLLIHMDSFKVKNLIKKYKLAIPTTKQLIKIIKHSTNRYWRSDYHFTIIEKLLDSLTYDEKVFIAYHNDFYTLRNLNDELVRGIIDESLNVDIIDASIDDYKTVSKEADEWIKILAILINGSDVKGLKEDEWSNETLAKIASTIVNQTQVFLKYEDLFKVFFITDIFPPTIADIKSMLRDTIVLSDTDSTCASYDEWVSWYFGKMVFSDKSMAIVGVVMTIMTQSLDHYIKNFGTNMNISIKQAEPLEMKNEFMWDIFVLTNMSKHYYANTIMQEGNIFNFKDPKKSLEKKGVNLIAPTVYQPVRDLSEDMEVDIMSTITSGKTLKLKKYIQQVLDMEQFIYTKLINGSPDIYKLEKIKDPTGYKTEPNMSPYLHYMLWEDVFSDKYGHAPDPMYMAVKIPTTINSKNDMNLYLNTLDDDIRTKLSNFITNHDKDSIKTYKLPLIIIYNNGVPDEIKPIIDYNRVIKDNCKVLYIVLETIGFSIKDGSTLHDHLGYTYKEDT